MNFHILLILVVIAAFALGAVLVVALSRHLNASIRHVAAAVAAIALFILSVVAFKMLPWSTACMVSATASLAAVGLGAAFLYANEHEDAISTIGLFVVLGMALQLLTALVLYALGLLWSA